VPQTLKCLDDGLWVGWTGELDHRRAPLTAAASAHSSKAEKQTWSKSILQLNGYTHLLFWTSDQLPLYLTFIHPKWCGRPLVEHLPFHTGPSGPVAGSGHAGQPTGAV